MLPLGDEFQLQFSGTVPMIDAPAYARWFALSRALQRLTEIDEQVRDRIWDNLPGGGRYRGNSLAIAPPPLRLGRISPPQEVT
jgi:hypothetical protein